jgi:segregation and condensation protein B
MSERRAEDDAKRSSESHGSSAEDDEQGLSLDRLSRAFARAIQGRWDPAADPTRAAEKTATGEKTAAGEKTATGEKTAATERSSARERSSASEHERLASGGGPTGGQDGWEIPPVGDPANLAERQAVDACCPLSPRSIVEAILFVGHPENQPLSSRLIAALMRGVHPAEVDELIEELNASYAADGAPYEIVFQERGYLMQLRPEFDRLRNKFQARIREARLSQAAIEVLALVAYNQPVSRQRVDQLRGKASGPILAQLVRRDLLSVQRDASASRAVCYRTTDRFLDVFGLNDLADLPQPHPGEAIEF